MDKLLLIKLSALGDLAQVEPFLPSLASSYELTLLTSPLGKAYYHDHPAFSDILVLPDKRLTSMLRLIPSYLRRFDRVLDLQGNDRSALLRFFALCPAYGYHTRRYQHEPMTAEEQQLFVKDSVLERITLSTVKQLPEVQLEFTPYHYQAGEHLVLHVGASPGWESKRLPDNLWQQFARQLYERFNLRCLLTGAEDEREYVAHIAGQLDIPNEMVAGKTSLDELKAILDAAQLTLSTDSGPMHISAVKHTPTIGLFGATDWIRSAPYGYWSSAVFSHQVYPDGKPPAQSQRAAGEYYSGISITEALAGMDNIFSA